MTRNSGLFAQLFGDAGQPRRDGECNDALIARHMREVPDPGDEGWREHPFNRCGICARMAAEIHAPAQTPPADGRRPQT